MNATTTTSKVNKSQIKREIKALKAKAAKLWETRCWAMEREEACLKAYLTGHGLESRFVQWAEKRSEIGVEYYETCDRVIELEELIGE